MPGTVHSAPIGVENLVIATLTDEANCTYSTVTSVAPLINIKVNPKSNTDTLYADDRAVETVTSLGEIDVEIETQDLPLEIQATMLGHVLDAVTGVMAFKATDIAPYVALGFKIKKANGKYRYVWLLKGKFEELGEEASTQEDKAKFQTPKLKGTFLTRTDGLWKYTMDENSAITPLTNFLATVYSQIVDVVAPTVTTVPLDAATGVSGTNDLVFTFSKAIQIDAVIPANIFLIKADGTAVTTTLSIGTNNTIVTMHPTTILGAGSYIAVITTNIKSIAGVPIETNCVVNFTV